MPFAIPMFLKTAFGFFGKVPWQIYAGLAVLVLCGLSYCKGRADMDARWIAKLEAAQDKAEAKAVEAAQSADANEQGRVGEFTAEQDALGDLIDEAEASGDNALDALFGV